MITLKENSLIPNEGLYYRAAIEQIRRSEDFLRPVYEAFTNALEGIRDAQRTKDNGEITVTLLSTRGLSDELSFDRIVIEDNGIGFNESNFRRLLMFKDTRKGYLNKGSGRIQLIHFFDKCEFESTFKDGASFKTRTFTLSKAQSYLDKNSIVYYKDTVPASRPITGTKVTLRDLIVGEKENYDKLTVEELKEKILDHYLVYLCSNKDRLPKITFRQLDQHGLIQEERITKAEIPDFDKTEPIKFSYSKKSDDSNDIIRTDRQEEFLLRALKLDKTKLKRNGIRLTSKHEIVENPKIQLDCLAPEDNIENNRYMFLLSGPYLDRLESDTRGEIEIPTAADFLKQHHADQPKLVSSEEILLDDIHDGVNKRVLGLYREIKRRIQDQERDLEELKEMFQLDASTVENAQIALNDSDEGILAKVYKAESDAVAKKDAAIKRKIDELDSLDPSVPEYDKQLEEAVTDLVTTIPSSNRTALTHYVARRKLVLELFQKILDRQLTVQVTPGRNNDESLLHNLIFQQSSDSPDKSDLWLFNEEFVYFSGSSNVQLRNIKFNGVKIIKNPLTDEEEEYRVSLGENRLQKQPDILLFPNEGKCIIIEFKNPNENVADHLAQINKYASWLRNLTKDQFAPDTFFGYLIGQSIDVRDVRAADSDFKHSSHFDYMFRPAKTVLGEFGRSNGSIYTEVLKYSTLLERASLRNKIFLEKIKSSKSAAA